MNTQNQANSAFDIDAIKAMVQEQGSCIVCTLPQFLEVTGVEFGSDDYHDVFDWLETELECSVIVSQYNDVVATNEEWN
jgi:hypothetical protein